jgi:hypothetical protein
MIAPSGPYSSTVGSVPPAQPLVAAPNDGVEETVGVATGCPPGALGGDTIAGIYDG